MTNDMDLDSLRAIIGELGMDVASLSTLHADPTIATLIVPVGGAAVSSWLMLRGALDRTGVWPVIAGEAAAASRNLTERLESDQRAVTHVLATVPTGDPILALREYERARWERIKRFLESTGNSIPELSRDRFEPAISDDVWEQWPNKTASNLWSMHSAYDILKRTPLEACLLALLPTIQPAEAPVYLRFGGFNECPSPDVHTAFMRDWGRRYGAVPVCITRDVIECHVRRPPQTPDDARRLAREQAAYCSDIVSQGTQSVERLAIELWKSPQWYFWWD